MLSLSWTHNIGWFKKIDSILYIYSSWNIHDIWMIYMLFERRSHDFQILLLERSSNTQPCSSVSLEQNYYYAAQEFLRVSEENVRWIQESCECSLRKSTRRASRELEIPQLTVWRVLRCCLLFNWVHLFESPCLITLLVTVCLLSSQKIIELCHYWQEKYIMKYRWSGTVKNPERRGLIIRLIIVCNRYA